MPRKTPLAHCLVSSAIFLSGLGFASLPMTILSPAHAQVIVEDIIVRRPPPPLPVYVQPELPGLDYIWMPGYWAWNNASLDYYWVPGTWVLAPEPGYLWTPGYWGWHDSVYSFHQGYWGHHIG